MAHIPIYDTNNECIILMEDQGAADRMIDTYDHFQEIPQDTAKELAMSNEEICFRSLSIDEATNLISGMRV